MTSVSLLPKVSASPPSVILYTHPSLPILPLSLRPQVNPMPRWFPLGLIQILPCSGEQQETLLSQPSSNSLNNLTTLWMKWDRKTPRWQRFPLILPTSTRYRTDKGRRTEGGLGSSPQMGKLLPLPPVVLLSMLRKASMPTRRKVHLKDNDGEERRNSS